MDIFTTVLTRVVPVPIKPTSLKVKALLKDAGAGKLKEDLDHLENHDYYFADKKQKEDDKNKTKDDKQAESTKVESADKNHEDDNDDVVTESSDGTKHLDLYV